MSEWCKHIFSAWNDKEAPWMMKCPDGSNRDINFELDKCYICSAKRPEPPSRKRLWEKIDYHIKHCVGLLYPEGVREKELAEIAIEWMKEIANQSHLLFDGFKNPPNGVWYVNLYELKARLDEELKQ